MSGLFSFFLKRVCILYVVVLIVCFFSKHQKIPMIAALTISVLFSLLRFALLEHVFKFLGNKGKKNFAIIINLMIYLLNLVIIGIMIVISLRIGVYTFIAALFGTFSVMIIIMVNTVTEALGITENQYGQKVK